MPCPKCKAPLERHELSPGIFVSHCPSCFGVLYRADDLVVPLALVGPAPARFDCPSCRRPMETAKSYEGQIEVDRCAACGLFWFDAGEIQILRKLSGVENLVEEREEGAPAAPPAAAKGAAEKVEKEQKAPQPLEMSGASNPDEHRAPVVEFEGRVYRHFQTSVPVTTSVMGEFPWVAKIGDAARMRDFICPPYLISQEITGKDATWSAGEYLEPEEVWTAFALPGSPPSKIGVAPAQPNPWSAGLSSVWFWFGLAAVACVGSFVFASAVGSGERVYEGGFSVAATDAERSRVGEIFEIKGRTANLELTLNTNVDQAWAYISMALIDADTDRALDFGRELSYYYGSEDGEGWAEGSKYETLIVPRVPPGRYYLRVEPETDAAQLSFSVTARRDVPLKRLPLLALALLLAPALWASLRQDSFESTRWMESDHPRVSSDGEDDE